MTPNDRVALNVCVVLLTGLLVSTASTAHAQPANDACTTATVIGSLPFTNTVNTATATTAVGDRSNCNGRSRSVWYTFTSGTSTQVTVTTAGSSYDTVLDVFRGTCTASDFVSCNDDFVGRQSQVTFSACAGKTYQIEVNGFGSSNSGGTLALNASSSPGNLGDADADGVDDCTDNCPSDFNPDQADDDADGIGDTCDACPATPDSDADGICDAVDNCSLNSNPDQTDIDEDGIGDACDNCPSVANPDQADTNLNGIADACEPCTPPCAASRAVALVPNANGRQNKGGSLPTSGFPGGYQPAFTNVDPVAIGATDDLSRYDTVVLVGICDIGSNLFLGNPAWKGAIDAFIARGGKLIIWDSECKNTNYSNFILPFTTNNPGELGETGWLGIAEQNSLSSSNPPSSRYVDVNLVGSDTDAVGDANVFLSFDNRWCVDMRAVNASIGQPPRPTHTYAGSAKLRPAGLGRGLVIYSGLDKDYLSDGQEFDTVSGEGNLGRIWLFELQQPFNPDALPCGTSALCGNSAIEPPEECDPLAASTCPAGRICDQDDCVCVTPPSCGDGSINAPETCDPIAVPTDCGSGEVCDPRDCRCVLEISMCGDVDRDESITVTDGALAFRTATDLLSPCRPETCDMTGTGLPITVSDGANVLLLAAGLPGLAQCPLPGSAVQATTTASSTSTIGDRAAKPPSPAALAKLADKCQRELGRQVVKALQQQLSPLDRCISGVFKCVATAAADLSVCLAKARPECVEKAQTKVTKGQESALRKIVNRCAAVDLGELRDATGLGYTNVSADCLARQNLDLCDAKEVAQCLVAETDLSAARLYGMQAPRAYELYRLVRPLPFIVGEQPLDPFSDLPAFGGGQSPPGPPPASGTDIQKCGSTITRAGNAFATRGLATIQKCLTNLFTCVRVKPGDRGCLGTAQAKCATDLQKLTQSTKLEDTIRKGCGTLPFGALLRSDGLNLEALLTICPGLGVPALNGLDDYLTCLRQSQQCRLLDLVRFAVPRGETLLPGDALEVALHGDRCPSPPAGGTLTSTPSARAGTVVSGIRRFISNVLRGSSSGGYHRGVAPASTANARRRVTDVSASRFAFQGLSNRLFVRYTRGVALARAASPVAAALSSPPALFIRVERADHSVVPDYFDIALPPDPPVGQVSSECPTLDECEVAVDLEFPDDLRGCTFNVLVAAGENGEVSDYKGVEQVPAVPPDRSATVVFTINGKPGVQAFRLSVRYPLEKGTFAGAQDQVMCALTAGAANVFVPNNKEDGTLLLSAGNVPAFAFPVEVRCTFDTLTRASLKSKAITSKDIKVGVDEITVGGVPADPAALTVKVQVPKIP